MRLVLTALSIFALAFTLECACALFDQEYWFDELMLGYSQGPKVRINQQDNPDIAFYGDSFTVGCGVDEDEAFPSLISHELGVSVSNYGIGGSLTCDWADSLSLHRTDVNVVTFFLRDGTGMFVQKDFVTKVKEESVKINKLPTHLLRFINRRILNASLTRKYAHAFTDAYENGDEWAVAQENIIRMKDMSEKFYFVIFPVLVALDEPYVFQDVVDTIIFFCKTWEIEYLDLTPYFIGQNEPEMWASMVDQHPSPKAHKIAAEAIIEKWF